MMSYRVQTIEKTSKVHKAAIVKASALTLVGIFAGLNGLLRASGPLCTTALVLLFIGLVWGLSIRAAIWWDNG